MMVIRGLRSVGGSRGRTAKRSSERPRGGACWRVLACSCETTVHRMREKMAMDSISRLGSIGDSWNDSEKFSVRRRNAMMQASGQGYYGGGSHQIAYL